MNFHPISYFGIGLRIEVELKFELGRVGDFVQVRRSYVSKIELPSFSIS